MTTSTPRLGSVPQEVLEHIAFCAATQGLVGPPSGLLPLLLTCRNIYRALSVDTNPLLYARVFSSQFDARAALRRLGSHVNTPRILASELKKRWIHLKRIRARTHTRIQHTGLPSGDLIDALWLAYLMMLENDGRNEQQLLDWAEMDVWLMEYWFDDQGASSAVSMVLEQVWPVEDEKNAIAMWLFWLLLRPDSILCKFTKLRHMMTITKLTALAANHYPVCHPSWSEFLPQSGAIRSPSSVTHFSETYQLHPPVLSPAAILVFLNLALRVLLPVGPNYTPGYSFQSPASLSLTMRRSEDWDRDWYRCIHIGQPDRFRALSQTFLLGSLEGVWEGVFAYTEFSSYTSLLSGGDPSVLDHCLIGHHKQTWKLREYHFIEDRESGGQTSGPLAPGDPLTAHFPAGARFRELADAVQIQEPGGNVICYWRPSSAKHGDRVVDVILLGEGHSAWGQFSVYGRVRPLDGLISLSKQYVEDERGRWLYRGYLVGNTEGYISGRWRDTLSPVNVQGYEGCFVMGRRR